MSREHVIEHLTEQINELRAENERLKGRKTMRIKLEPWAIKPTRAHKEDAGLDVYTPTEIRIPAGGSKAVDTGVHIELPEGTAGILKSKSGLNVKYGITSTGVIDEGYTGSIVVNLYNNGTDDVQLATGAKISQLLIVPVLRPDVEVVDEIQGKERGDNGFGSTGI